MVIMDIISNGIKAFIIRLSNQIIFVIVKIGEQIPSELDVLCYILDVS